MQICVLNYNDAEIEAVKSIVHDLIPDRSRRLKRKSEDKKKNMKDVLKLIKETDPDKHSVFVAKDLSGLLPMSFNHIDVSKLSKDFTQVKVEIKSLREDSIPKRILNKYNMNLNNFVQ